MDNSQWGRILGKRLGVSLLLLFCCVFVPTQALSQTEFESDVELLTEQSDLSVAVRVASYKLAKDNYALSVARWPNGSLETAIAAEAYGDRLVAVDFQGENFAIREHFQIAAKLFRQCIELINIYRSNAVEHLLRCQAKEADALSRQGLYAESIAAYGRVLAMLPAPMQGQDAWGYVVTAHMESARLIDYKRQRNKDEDLWTQPSAELENAARIVGVRMQHHLDAVIPMLRVTGDPINLEAALMMAGKAAELRLEPELARQMYKESFTRFAERLNEQIAHNSYAYLRYQVTNAAIESGFFERRDTYREDVRYGSIYEREKRKEWCLFHHRGNDEIEICLDQLVLVEFPNKVYKQNRKGFIGFAVVQYDLNEKGRAKNINIIESWPDNQLDKTALKIIKKSTYLPPINQNNQLQRVNDMHKVVQFRIAD